MLLPPGWEDQVREAKVTVKRDCCSLSLRCIVGAPPRPLPCFATSSWSTFRGPSRRLAQPILQSKGTAKSKAWRC